MKNLFATVLIFVTPTIWAQDSVPAKSRTIPPKLVCSILNGNMQKDGEVTILSDFGDDPLVIVRSSTERLLNFKIGRGFAAGEYQKKSSDITCESKISRDKSPLYFEYSCKYADEKIAFVKSRFVYSISGVRWQEICREIMPQGMDGNICWSLADCH